MKKEKFGFLRETTENAIKAGIDKDTGLHRTGLDEYLKIIFPNIDDWIHDKPLGLLPDGSRCRKRPDYRSEKLKLIVEFDGIQHYQKLEQIIQDHENTELYESLGYKVVRIPYFIQLTNDAVEQLFGKKVRRKLFNVQYPSLGIDNGPAHLCPGGITRMAHEFLDFPEQLKVNLLHLWELDNDYLTGASLLDKAINDIVNDHQIDFNYLFTYYFNDELQQLYDDVYNCHACVREDLLNGDMSIESYLISHKDFYEIFYMNNFDKTELEDKLINLFYDVFYHKQNYLINYDILTEGGNNIE